MSEIEVSCVLLIRSNPGSLFGTWFWTASTLSPAIFPRSASFSHKQRRSVGLGYLG
jgi:hypothetical protein